MSHMHDIFTRAIQFHGSPLCKPCVLHGVATDGGEIHTPPVTHCIGQKTPQMRPALGIHVVPSCPRGLVEIFQMHFLWTKRRPPVFIGVFLKIFKRTCTNIGACLEWSFVVKHRGEQRLERAPQVPTGIHSPNKPVFCTSNQTQPTQ